jgi:phage terminase large subunit-like protein
MDAVSGFRSMLKARGSLRSRYRAARRSMTDPEDRVFVAVDPATSTANDVVVLRVSTDGLILVLETASDAEDR